MIETNLLPCVDKVRGHALPTNKNKDSFNFKFCD